MVYTNNLSKTPLQKTQSLTDEQVKRNPCNVLLGRGGHSHKFQGNQRLRESAEKLALEYFNAKKPKKTELSKLLVTKTLYSSGNFYAKNKTDDKWHIASDDEIRKKASQCLRDIARIYDIEPLPLPYGSLYGLSLENARKTLEILSGSDEPPAKRQRTGQAKDPNNPKYN